MLALLDADDERHLAAAEFFAATEEALLTHSYVVVETIALVQRRFDAGTLRLLVEALLPAFETVWIGEELHRLAESSLLSASPGRASFVDRVSFELMRRDGIRQAFAFDRDFDTNGFETVP